MNLQSDSMLFHDYWFLGYIVHYGYPFDWKTSILWVLEKFSWTWREATLVKSPMSNGLTQFDIVELVSFFDLRFADSFRFCLLVLLSCIWLIMVDSKCYFTNLTSWQKISVFWLWGPSWTSDQCFEPCQPLENVVGHFHW